MAIERERKFLLTETPALSTLTNGREIIQGYLSDDPERTVRVRIVDNFEQRLGFITIKSKKIGDCCFEYEYQIPVFDAVQMLNLCKHAILKNRYDCFVDGFKYEIDIFKGERAGLQFVEVELEPGVELKILPSFCGLEVTHDHRYSNSLISSMSYNDWKVLECLY